MVKETCWFTPLVRLHAIAALVAIIIICYLSLAAEFFFGRRVIFFRFRPCAPAKLQLRARPNVLPGSQLRATAALWSVDDDDKASMLANSQCSWLHLRLAEVCFCMHGSAYVTIHYFCWPSTKQQRRNQFFHLPCARAVIVCWPSVHFAQHLHTGRGADR